MLFNSIYYAFFLPLVVILFWVVPRRIRYPFLLVASYLFYMNWIPAYVGLILALTVVNYGFGFLIARQRSRAWLALAVVVDLGVLGYFKYANFFIGTARAAGLDAATANILLPLGISFFTFEFIHYVVDVWRGSPPVRNFVQFALFAAFFPTQIAGPIKRYQAFVHQLQEYPAFNLALAYDGLFLILRGLFKKVILADSLARIANLGFDNPTNLSSAETWIAVYAFAFQIFFDFSGYTDIGRGSAQLFGFTVPENFAAPYLARNLADFWRRWHMSLSSWLRDYLFIPLGGSRGSRLENYRNLFLTMALGGLWHGAAWHFVLWGSFQGVGLVALRWMGDHGILPRKADPFPGEAPPPGRFARWRSPLGYLLAMALTFHFTCLSWVLFRASDIPTMRQFLMRMIWPTAGEEIYAANDRWIVLGVMIGYFVLVGGVHWLRDRVPEALQARVLHWEWTVRPAYAVVLILWMIIFPAAAQSFIYFQF
jgi:alginate O-acetyltransferase complex protein AlgI